MRVVIVGTGTEIGKTHVTSCLLAEARRQGVYAAGYKPIATGVGEQCEDAAVHALALQADVLAPTFAYAEPVSPHLAARWAGRPVDLASIQHRAEELEQGRDVLVVEAAGGLLTPLGEAITNVDLIHALGPTWLVLVAPDRLGVLHDVGVCQTAASALGIRLDHVVLSAPAVPDDSTGTNAAELHRLGRVKGEVVVFPRAAFDAEASGRAAAALWQHLRGSQPFASLP